MKKLLAVVLSIAMIASLATCYVVNTSARTLPMTAVQEIGKATTAPDVTDGVVDSIYTKIFDMTGSESAYYAVDEETGAKQLKPTIYFLVGYNKEVDRYDYPEHLTNEESDWWNTRAEGYAAWDEDYLYLCVVLTTPAKLDNNPGASWSGDCIQFGIYTRGTVEYGFSQDNGEIQSVLHVGTQNGAIGLTYRKYVYDNKNVPSGYIGTKGENTIVYELALSWKAMGIASGTEGLSYPFNLTINLNDENMDPNKFCGFQIGQGIFNETTSTHDGLADSIKLKLVSSHTHTSDDVWHYDDANHWNECTQEGEVLNLAAHTGGTATCQSKAICSVCGQEYGSFGDHVVDENVWYTDGDTHYQICTICGEHLNVSEHEGGEATCIAKAVCSICGQEYGEIDPNNHVNTTAIGEVPATPTTPGNTGVVTCNDCGNEIANGEIIPVDTKDTVDSISGIIKYLDNVKDIVKDEKTITELLQEALDAYEEDPNEETFNNIISTWDNWTYGGQDAHDVFFTKTLLDLIDLFPKQADGSVYIEAGAAKRTPEQLAAHIQAVDKNLYVDAAPSDFFDGTISTELLDGDTVSIKAMNEAKTASEAYAIFYQIIGFINENCELYSYNELVSLVEFAEIVAGNEKGDAELLEILKESLAYVEESLTAVDEYNYADCPPAGFVQYRPSGQATSFTEDVETYSSKYDLLYADLYEVLYPYAETVPAPELISGENGTWQKESEEGLSFELDCKPAEVDGVIVGISWDDIEAVSVILEKLGDETLSDEEVAELYSELKASLLKIAESVLSEEDFENLTAIFEKLEDENLSVDEALELEEQLSELLMKVTDCVISEEFYTVTETENGTLVTLLPEYLETLDLGEQNIIISTYFGAVSTTFTVNAAPEKPVDPDNPEDPVDPENPEDPETPVDPDNSETTDPGNSSDNNSGSGPENTSDVDLSILFIITIISAGAVMLLTVAAKKRYNK